VSPLSALSLDVLNVSIVVLEESVGIVLIDERLRIVAPGCLGEWNAE
jgi:hypothetical protein